MDASRWRAGLFTVAMTLVSRVLMARDSLLGVTRGLRKYETRQEFFFASGGRRLAAVLVEGPRDAPVVLICHGIGETVEHWSAVQAYLRKHGVGSMVFNYSGYGASSGKICAEHCDEDLVSAYADLKRRVGVQTPVFVLGFSLGSGIAGSGVRSLTPPAAGLFLCEAFTSFREAVHAVGIPLRWVRAAPDVWNTVEAMRGIQLPVCVVHSDGDRLFPMEMPRQIVASCMEWGELVVVSGLAHNEPYLKPGDSYWGPIVARMLAVHAGREG
jgi:alpha/beta superfamily hydrolase